jgi:transmembrane protein 33
MAPPPPQNLPLQQRLMQLAQTLQFAWFVGHVTLLLSTLRYGLSYIFFATGTKMARFSYRLAFVAAAATYGIVVYKGYRSRMRSGKMGSPLSLIADENVQYLCK